MGSQSMAHTVDARGLSCPQPVLLTRKALRGNKLPVIVLLETVASRENVRRMAEKEGYTVTVEQVGEEFRVTLTK